MKLVSYIVLLGMFTLTLTAVLTYLERPIAQKAIEDYDAQLGNEHAQLQKLFPIGDKHADKQPAMPSVAQVEACLKPIASNSRHYDPACLRNSGTCQNCDRLGEELILWNCSKPELHPLQLAELYVELKKQLETRVTERPINHWDWSGSFLFSVTILSTIGCTLHCMLCTHGTWARCMACYAHMEPGRWLHAAWHAMHTWMEPGRWLHAAWHAMHTHGTWAHVYAYMQTETTRHRRLVASGSSLC